MYLQIKNANKCTKMNEIINIYIYKLLTTLHYQKVLKQNPICIILLQITYPIPILIQITIRETAQFLKIKRYVNIMKKISQSIGF